jgi:hypothetical protein
MTEVLAMSEINKIDRIYEIAHELQHEELIALITPLWQKNTWEYDEYLERNPHIEEEIYRILPIIKNKYRDLDVFFCEHEQYKKGIYVYLNVDPESGHQEIQIEVYIPYPNNYNVKDREADFLYSIKKHKDFGFIHLSHFEEADNA